MRWLWMKLVHESRRERSLRRERDRLLISVRELETSLACEQSRVKILELEQEQLLAVNQRDRKRIEAETKSYASEIVAHERRRVEQ